MANKQLTTQEIEFCELIAKGSTITAAGEAVKICYKTACRWMDYPHIKECLDAMNAKATEKAVAESGLTKAWVIKRCQELASLDPGKTRDSIVGQVKALELLHAWLGPQAGATGKAEAGATPDIPAAEPNVYRSKWMKSGDPVQ